MYTKEPVRGMRDILPSEMELREYILSKLITTYQSYGFQRIETPCMERAENLSNNQGGENERLVFKVLKRGDKLAKAIADGDAEDLFDSGLRYDLTVPLARYYSHNADSLPKPFKALQIGPVWRADRPQKDRFRQFIQCDIDIIGDPTPNAEVELIAATSTFLEEIGIPRFTIMINDRRILQAVAAVCGFDGDAYEDVLTTLDKFDKVGLDGVCTELAGKGYRGSCIDSYRNLFSRFLAETDRFAYCRHALGPFLDEGVLSDLEDIIAGVSVLSHGRFVPDLAISLVRGMGYYTGPVYEVKLEGTNDASIAGGGRYDNLVNNFTGTKTEACGFSVGFERIVRILVERGVKAPSRRRIAALYDRSLAVADITELQEQCQTLRDAGDIVTVQPLNRNLKYQKEQLSLAGYRSIRVIDDKDGIASFVDATGRS